MRLVMWIFAILFTLAGLALRADDAFGMPGAFAGYAPALAKGLFVLAVFACPFFWAPRYRMMGPFVLPGRMRFMLALALIVATPLLLPWPG